MSGLLDGYDVETDQGMAHVVPFERLLSDAATLVALENWQSCPECGRQCPLFYGDPDGEHRCAFCQLEHELGITDGET
jgi:uncharacterized Zn finger protein (UPF0148 family)